MKQYKSKRVLCILLLILSALTLLGIAVLYLSMPVLRMRAMSANASLPAWGGALFTLYRYRLPIGIAALVLYLDSLILLLRIRRKQRAELAAQTEEPEEPPHRKKHSGSVVLAIILVLAFIIALLPKNTAQDSSVEVVTERREAVAERGTLTEKLIYAGALSTSSSEDVSLAGSIKLESFNVMNGESVEAGQLLATVDRNSVMRAISSVTDRIAELDEELDDTRSDKIDADLTAPAAGRIMAVFAEKGESVVDTMYEHGALMLLSLDGRLAVSVDAGSLTTGDQTEVRRENAPAVAGTVASVADGTAVVTVPDDAANWDESVSVYDASGELRGEGRLYVHSELKLTGYTGTVASVYVTAGRMVSSGQRLLTLSDTGYTGRYSTLLSQREELEQQLSALFDAYRSGGVYASEAGTISNVNEDIVKESTRASKLSANAIVLGTELVLFEGEGLPPQGEGGETPPEGGGETPPEEEETEVSVYGKLSAINLMGGSMTLSLLTGGERTLGFMELMGVADLAQLASAKVGDILELVCDKETNAIKSVILYSAPTGEGGGTHGGFPFGGFGGFSFNSSSDTEEEERDYAMEETTICSLTRFDTAEITVSVDELDIMRLAIGDEVAVTLDALSDRSFVGTITDMEQDGTNSGGNSKFAVTVTIERGTDMLEGMNANVYVTLGERSGLLLLPTEAVQEDAGGVYVYTGYDEKTETFTGRREIETGFSDGARVEILSGIEEGERVVYSFAEKLEYTFLN